MSKCVPGVNDLATKRPDLAAQAHGWDPGQVSFGSAKKLDWVCQAGHVFVQSVTNRTSSQASGCPYCANKAVLKGYNDFRTKFPEIAKEAKGWDPSYVLPGNETKRRWVCPRGHEYWASAEKRSIGRGCSVCAGKQVIAGKTDLATKFPAIAAEADGWEPSEFSPHSNKKVSWVCSKHPDHRWQEKINNRTSNGHGCPICSNQKLLTGFNDLETINPELAAEANGWDPSLVFPSAKASRSWKCKKCGYVWEATINSRCGTKESGDGSGCPICAETGFNRGKEGWMYLMNRPGEQQFGISNVLERRLAQHAREGWQEQDRIGPFDGEDIWMCEVAVKVWLKNQVGTIGLTRETWSTTDLEVQTLKELFDRAEIHEEFRLI